MCRGQLRKRSAAAVSGARADLTKIIALRDEHDHQTFDLLPRLPKFRDDLQSTPNTRLWVIDPISSYLGQVKENHDRSVRGLLNPLANLAAAHHIAIMLVTHLSKGDGKALHRVLGSRAFGAAARNVWLVSEDADDEKRRLLVSMKHNRTAPPTGLAFTIESVGNGNYVKRSSTVFLQIVIVLIGIDALAFMLWEPNIEGRNAHSTIFEVYFKDPFLAYAYIAAIPFFVALYQAFKVLGYAGQNQVFSQAAVNALRTIKYSRYP